jgi:hypothetical protein
MRRIAMGVFLFSWAAFAQSDRGTITGTITDSAGAVVSGAPIEVQNVETGVVFHAASTETGNFTIAQVPVGTYELSVTVAGFKKYRPPEYRHRRIADGAARRWSGGRLGGGVGDGHRSALVAEHGER